MAKKMVVEVDLQDDKGKRKALKTVSTLPGIDSIAMDMKEKKLTVIGAVDPINVVTKLRKRWPAADILLVGPAKEPEKPADKKDDGGKPADDGKKEAPKKEGGASEPKKEEKKEAGEGKKEANGGGNKEEEAAMAAPEYDPAVMEMVKGYKAYNPVYMETYHVESEEENPNACAIC